MKKSCLVLAAVSASVFAVNSSQLMAQTVDVSAKTDHELATENAALHKQIDRLQLELRNAKLREQVQSLQAEKDKVAVARYNTKGAAEANSNPGAQVWTGSAAAVSRAAASTYAADMPVKAPVYKSLVAVPYNWTGFYVGGQIGGAWGRDNASIANPGIPFPPPIFIPFTVNTSGGMGGFHAGYNYQVSQWVFGLEGSVDWTKLDKTFIFGICPLFCGTATTKSDWQGSASCLA